MEGQLLLEAGVTISLYHVGLPAAVLEDTEFISQGSLEKHNQLIEDKIYLCLYTGFSGGSAVKNLSANAGVTGSISGSERAPGGQNGYPPQYSCLENLHGQRSLEGYSPWGCRVEQDLATKQQISVYQ